MTINDLRFQINSLEPNDLWEHKYEFYKNLIDKLENYEIRIKELEKQIKRIEPDLR